MGFGTLGFLVRARVDEFGRSGRTEMTGVESFAGYVGDVQRQLYDRVVIADARSWLRAQGNGEYDLVAALDVVEHLVHSDALHLIAEMKRVGRNVIVTTPGRHYSQGAVHGNAAEAHLSTIGRRDLPDAVIIDCPDTIVAVYGSASTMAVARRAARRQLVPPRLLRTLRGVRHRGVA
jgi:hypothetical protein